MAYLGLSFQQPQAEVSKGTRSKVMDLWDRKEMVLGSDSLLQAVFQGQISKVRQILRQAASLSSKCPRGISPLLAALHIHDDEKRARMFLLLLKNGASWTAKDDLHQRSVLHWACALGKCQQVSELLEETAGDIDLLECDKDGLTALHHAVLAGDLQVVEILLKFHSRFGVTVDVTDNLGLTPYLHARRLGYKEIADVLRIKGQASEGRADNLFRSPREWSQIGKTERQKAREMEIINKIKAAKIMGKPNLIKNSEKMAYMAISVNENFISKRKPNNVHHNNNLSHSLARSVIWKRDLVPDNPAASLFAGESLHSHSESAWNKTKAKSPVTFAGTNSNLSSGSSSFKPPAYVQKLHTHKDNTSMVVPKTTRIGCSNQNRTSAILIQQQLSQDYSHHRHEETGVTTETKPRRKELHFSPHTNDADFSALSLIKYTAPKSRTISEFHNSELDTSNEFLSEHMVEFKHMAGNLTSLLDILSEQRTKSFRKGVQAQKPKFPQDSRTGEKKDQLSTWAILFGDEKLDRPGKRPQVVSAVRRKKLYGNEKKNISTTQR